MNEKVQVCTSRNGLFHYTAFLVLVRHMGHSDPLESATTMDSVAGQVCVTSFIKGPLSCFETMLKANLKQQGLSCKTLFHVYPQILFSVEAFITIGTLVSLFFMY